MIYNQSFKAQASKPYNTKYIAQKWSTLTPKLRAGVLQYP